MTTSAPLEIKVVYSASKRHGRRRRRGGARTTWRGAFLVMLGLLNVVAAAGMYYGVWWKVDRFLYFKLMLFTPFPTLTAPPERESGVLVPKADDTPESKPSVDAAADEAPPLRFGGKTTQILLWSSAYGWLTLAAIANCALALSGGALLGGRCGSWCRILGTLFTVAAVAVLAYAGYQYLSPYGWEYPPNYWRTFMAGPVVICALLGLAIGRWARGLTYLAAVTLILSAIGSAMGLYLGTLCDAIDPAELPMSLIPFLILVFVAHSLWGWILLPLASRTGP